MANDTNLLLQNGAVTGNGQSTAINVTGGDFALVHLLSSVTPTDADETLAITVQASMDGGSSYVTIGTFPTLVKAADKGNAGTIIGIPIYIPRAKANPDGRGAQTDTKLRLGFTVGGTTPSFTIKAYVAPLTNKSYGSVAGFTSGNAARYGPLDAIQNWSS